MDTQNKCCSKCDETKQVEDFIKNRNICRSCNNSKRRLQYESDEKTRKKLIENATKFKQKKAIERNKLNEQLKTQLENEIGQGNTICKYCNEVCPKTYFRTNRLKCKNCERNNPIEKFKRNIRSRIFICLKKKKLHTIQYLGCNYEDYFKWIQSVSSEYSIENNGKLWHIDHVIPISKFDLDDETQVSIAFNWRNTMPLSCKENLAKNNKIVSSQVKQHYHNLLEYHKNNNIVMPQEFNDLFAKHLDAGNPLEPLLPSIHTKVEYG